MSYQLNKTDGTILIDLIDGQIDSASTNLTLVGRNYSGFGEFLNENFIKLLENFASTAAPSNPLEGQLWWDKSEARLKLWDGTQWKASGGPFVQNFQPQMVAGDLWIDNLNNQFYFYDGTDLVLVGPQYNSFQGLTGFKIDSILDEQSRSRPVAKLYVGGDSDENLVSVVSNIQFTPTFSQRIDGLVTDDNPDGIIKEGFNIIDTENFKFHGTAVASESLVTGGGDVVTADQFLSSISNDVTTGTLSIRNSGGLSIGTSENFRQFILGNATVSENQLRDANYRLRVVSSSFGGTKTDAMFVKADTAAVGIFNDNPQAMLHIGSSNNPDSVQNQDVIIEGNLIVRGESAQVIGSVTFGTETVIDFGTLPHKLTAGKQVRIANARVQIAPSPAPAVDLDLLNGYHDVLSTTENTATLDLDTSAQAGTYVTNSANVLGDYTSLSVQNLQVEDKNIELGIAEDSTLLSDEEMDNAGVIARVSGVDKTLLWRIATDSWTSNRNFDLKTSDKSYKIGGVDKVTNTYIDPSITQATGLVEVGTLEYLNVDNININNSSISTTGGTALQINSTGGNITLTTRQKIVNVDDPTDDQDAATKYYVDTEIASQPIVFSLDITGLATPDTQIATILQSMFPAANKTNGTYAFIHTTESSASTAENIDVDAAKNISFVAVDANGTQNESVVQDIAFFPASGTVEIAITRGLKRFRVQGTSWVFDADLPTGL
jgi:hypothetical protein